MNTILRHSARTLCLLLVAVLATRGADGGGPFEDEIRAFEATDKTAPPPRHAILFTGSSSIRLWTSLTNDFPGRAVFGRGFGGSQMSQLNQYAERIVLPYEPRHILVYEGDNDLAAGKTPAEIFSAFQQFVQTVHKRLPSTRISYLAIKPSRQRWALLPQIRETNWLIHNYARLHRRVDYIDTFSPLLDAKGNLRAECYKEDGLHLNRKGYDAWVKVVAPELSDR
jgi:lysophospholipase L1-like esterase